MSLASLDVDRWLQNTLHNMHASAWAPPCNAYENEHGFHIEIALPGVAREDMNIMFEAGVLTVNGHRKQTSSEDACRYFAQELGWGNFTRSFRLPSYIDPDKVSASCKEGMLVLTLPKREEVKPRRIEIA